MFQEFTKATALWPPAWSASQHRQCVGARLLGMDIRYDRRRTTFAVMFILQIGLSGSFPACILGHRHHS